MVLNKLFSALSITFLLSSTLPAQTFEEISTYNRNALSVMVLEGNNAHSHVFKAASSSIFVPQKFDDNTLNITSIHASANPQAILWKLQQEKVVNQILAEWFNRNAETGEMNMTVVHERGLYNATDEEVLQASATKIGMARLKDAGESLINHSYVMVLEFYNIQTMREVYNKRDLAKKAATELFDKNYEPVRRVKTGWVSDVKAYVFKVDMDPEQLNYFYEELWIYADDSEQLKAQKKQRFDESDFSLDLVTQVNGKGDGTQYKPGHVLAKERQLNKTELFARLINTGLNSCVDKTENSLESFKVKTKLYKVRPLSAKVGKKEGLKTDDRYMVKEFQQDNKGDLKAKNKGVVRVKKSVDNRTVATGNTEKLSTFYQTFGGKLETGMLLYQKNDLGWGIVGGASFGEIGGGWGKIEINLARLSSGLFDLGISQLYVFGTMGVDYGDYNVLGLGTTYDMTFTRWQVGLSKGFYFARRMQLAPFIAFGAESGSNSDMNRDFGWSSDDFIGADYFNAGVSGTLALTHFMQIYGALNYYMPFPYTYSNQRTIWDYGVFYNTDYTDFFADRSGLSWDLGVRIEF